jgi:hypothetical protein
MARLEINTTLQGSLIRRYWRDGKVVLYAACQPVLDLAGQIDAGDLKRRTRMLLIAKPVEDYLTGLWVATGSVFAKETVNQIQHAQAKSDEWDFWEDHFRRYIRERSAAKLLEIMDTQAEMVNALIDAIVEDALTEGASIYEVQRALREDLPGRLTEITKYQAERIARTEVIGASNTGSFEGAKESGVALAKNWSTSGLPGIRQTHLDYEALGSVPMDYEYATGLLYPGDPDCPDGSDIINCRCSPTYETD